MIQILSKISVALLTMLLTKVGCRVEAAYINIVMSQRGIWKPSRSMGGASRRQKGHLRSIDDDWNQEFPASQPETRDGATVAHSLLSSALGRAVRTMSTKADMTADENGVAACTVKSILQDVGTAIESSEASHAEARQSAYRSSANEMLETAMGRATRTLSTQSASNNESGSEQIDEYLSNPAINPTALAHKTWSHILRPNVDTVIDATCGNGNDSEAIASMLFTAGSVHNAEPQLVCIDIQKEACDSTRDRLSRLLDATTMERHVSVLQTSHDPLPRPRDESSVGLVCYNLGYLPQSNQDMLTQMDTTVSSIADAALLLRVGGMLSVMTYPRSNLSEDYAVHALLEGMALLTSKRVNLQDYVDNLGPDPSGDDDDISYSVRDAVRIALDRIVAEGPRQQTWRVMENKMLGRPLSPALLTATRIK